MRSNDPTPAGSRTQKTLKVLLWDYSRALVIVGAVVLVLASILLIVVAALDAFNAGVYRLDGKSVNDATEEARAIRESFSPIRTGGWIAFGIALVFVLIGAVGLFLKRRAALARGEDEGDTSVDEILS